MSVLLTQGNKEGIFCLSVGIFASVNYEVLPILTNVNKIVKEEKSCGYLSCFWWILHWHPGSLQDSTNDLLPGINTVQ